MKIQVVARGQKMGCRSGDECEKIAIWDGLRTEDLCGPSQHRVGRQTAGKTSICDVVLGETQGD